MPRLAVNPAAFPFLSPLAEPATNGFPAYNGGGGLHPSHVVVSGSRLAAMAADFFREARMGTFVLERVSRLGSPPWFGHRFGAIHAPCGSSLFCFGPAALRVTVSLQILFAKCAEKISSEPP